jgi:hypothetical protein
MTVRPKSEGVVIFLKLCCDVGDVIIARASLFLCARRGSYIVVKLKT